MARMTEAEAEKTLRHLREEETELIAKKQATGYLRGYQQGIKEALGIANPAGKLSYQMTQNQWINMRNKELAEMGRGSLTPREVLSQIKLHKAIVENALELSKHVPAKILKDYPSLTKKAQGTNPHSKKAKPKGSRKLGDKVNVKAVRREMGKMFKRVKGKTARAKEMKRIWARYKKGGK